MPSPTHEPAVETVGLVKTFGDTRAIDGLAATTLLVAIFGPLTTHLYRSKQ